MSPLLCRQVQASIHDYLDDELPVTASLVVAEHLQHCCDCADALRVEAAVRARIQQCCSADCAPPQLRVRIMTHISEVRVTYRQQSGDHDR
jgi:mycothiol system anti-sigma-R factor